MSLTPAQDLAQLVSGAAGAWLPFTLDVGAIHGLTAPVRRRFEKETGQADPAEHFDCDFRTASVAARFGGPGPQRFHAGTELPPGTTFDQWVVGHWSGGGEATVAGGILCSSNLIQPETPWANTVAFAEEARLR